MKTPQVIQSAAYGPETLKVIGKAFDDAWAEIATNFTETKAEAARFELANAILSVAKEDSRNAEELKNAALQAMAIKRRS